jgi:hypothetical protein
MHHVPSRLNTSERSSEKNKRSVAVEFAHNHKQQSKGRQAGWLAADQKLVAMSRLPVQLKLPPRAALSEGGMVSSVSRLLSYCWLVPKLILLTVMCCTDVQH